MRDDQREELINVRAKKMTLQAELDNKQAENMLPDFDMPGLQMQSPSQMPLMDLAEQPPMPPLHESDRPSSSDGAEGKLLAKKNEMQKTFEDKLEKMRKKAEEIDERKRQRDEDKKNKMLQAKEAQEQFKNSAEGKAAEYLKGIDHLLAASVLTLYIQSL